MPCEKTSLASSELCLSQQHKCQLIALWIPNRGTGVINVHTGVTNTYCSERLLVGSRPQENGKSEPWRGWGSGWSSCLFINKAWGFPYHCGDTEARLCLSRVTSPVAYRSFLITYVPELETRNSAYFPCHERNGLGPWKIKLGILSSQKDETQLTQNPGILFKTLPQWHDDLTVLSNIDFFLR